MPEGTASIASRFTTSSKQQDDPTGCRSHPVERSSPLFLPDCYASATREACLRAASRGVERTHIVDGRAPDALLLEVFTGEGVGTMIVDRKEGAPDPGESATAPIVATGATSVARGLHARDH